TTPRPKPGRYHILATGSSISSRRSLTPRRASTSTRAFLITGPRSSCGIAMAAITSISLGRPSISYPHEVGKACGRRRHPGGHFQLGGYVKLVKAAGKIGVLVAAAVTAVT